MNEDTATTFFLITSLTLSIVCSEVSHRRLAFVKFWAFPELSSGLNSFSERPCDINVRVFICQGREREAVPDNPALSSVLCLCSGVEFLELTGIKARIIIFTNLQVSIKGEAK